MHRILSRHYPGLDGETLREFTAKHTLLRGDDGSFLLHMDTDGEERLLFLGARDALIWLGESAENSDCSYWYMASPTG